MVSTYARIRWVFLLLLFNGIPIYLNALSSYSRNDPYPVFTSLDPHLFLLRNELLTMIGDRPEKTEPNRFGFSLSPFGQNADYGKTPYLRGCYFYNSEATDQCLSKCVELGDLDGRWNLISLLFGSLPSCFNSWAPTLQEAQQQLFPSEQLGSINHPELIDPDQEVGFVSHPGRYRKRGLRWEADIRLIDGFGLKFQSGFTDMSLSVTPKMFCSATYSCDCDANAATGFTTNVKKYLLCKYEQIARELCLDVTPFHEFYIEDIWATLYWRKAYDLTEHPDCPHRVIAIPFFTVDGAIALGKAKNPCKPFSLSFGNNGHHALGATAGLDFNFIESIEVGAEVGITHFFDRDVNCMRIPTSYYQSGVYPFWTDVTVSPGPNWHLGAKLATYHFLECLSFFFQYIYINHQEDKIKLKICDSAFCPSALERISSWNVQLANIGFNYDISQNISLGILWQSPIAQCNTYRSTTLLFSMNAIF